LILLFGENRQQDVNFQFIVAFVYGDNPQLC